MLKEIGISTGSPTFKCLFYKFAARHIAKRNGTKEKETPPPTPAFKIRWYKNQQEQIKRNPEVGNAQVGQYAVKKGIALIVIYLNEKPLIPLF